MSIRQWAISYLLCWPILLIGSLWLAANTPYGWTVTLALVVGGGIISRFISCPYCHVSLFTRTTRIGGMTVDMKGAYWPPSRCRACGKSLTDARPNTGAR